MVDTKKWSTGYLNPKGLEMHESLSSLDESELCVKCDELNIKLKEGLSKDELIHLIIKRQGGISKMKVNNQVASNPIGFYESGKNFADLPCRLIISPALILKDIMMVYLLFSILINCFVN